MKAKVFSFVKIVENSMIASVRIARFVSEKLGIPICWDTTIRDEKLNVLIIINGAFAFAGNELLAALGEAIEEADRVVWIQNDYTIIPPKDESSAESPFRKAFRNRHASRKPPVDYWTTVRAMSRPGVAKSGHVVGPSSRYINWNALSMKSDDNTASYLYSVRNFSERKYCDFMLYYGAFRKERVEYFNRYFNDPRTDFIISSPTSKFEDNYQSDLIVHVTKLYDLNDFLSNCGIGLYLEDKRSHVEFMSPANRFYEMLKAGLPIVFQPESKRMMLEAGYDITDYTVWDASACADIVSHREEICIQQRSDWLKIATGDYIRLIHDISASWEDLIR